MMSLLFWYTFQVVNWNQLKSELLRWNKVMTRSTIGTVYNTAS